jgi:excisionase family DNA binding protein
MTTEILTLEEVAEELRVSVAQVRRLIKEQALPHYRLSERRLLVDREDLREWLQSRRTVREGK